jgi:glycine oxidase
MKYDVDVCILGAGIGGSWLAYFLTEAGFNVRLLHDPAAQNASVMAAGLMQRVTGKYLTCSVYYNALFDDAVAAYTALEQRFDTSLITPLPLYKSLTPQLTSIWKKKRKRTRYKPLLSETECSPPDTSKTRSSSWIKISGGYFVHPDPFFTSLHQHLRDIQCLELTPINLNSLEHYKTYSRYKNITARYMITCLGSATSKIPAFQHIPFHFSNGETLQFMSTNQAKCHALQHTHWVIPYGNNQFKCGATYDHNPHCIPSKKGYDSLTDSITSLGHDTFTPLVYQRARRCNLPNHLPLLGLVTPSLGLFTGFGSKGFIAAPALAKQWAQVFPKTPDSFSKMGSE